MLEPLEDIKKTCLLSTSTQMTLPPTQMRKKRASFPREYGWLLTVWVREDMQLGLLEGKECDWKNGRVFVSCKSVISLILCLGKAWLES